MKQSAIPTLILLHQTYPHGSVEFHGDPFSLRSGVMIRGSQTLNQHATPLQRSEMRAWRAIQRERKRLGLPPLSREEMRL